MSSISGNKKAKRIAAVYSGAAFLILVMGIKTIVQTWPENSDSIIAFILPGLTVLAIVAEFILLNVYAITIATDLEPSQNDYNLQNSVDTTNLENKLEEFMVSNSTTVEKLNEISKLNAEYNNSIAKIGAGIESLVSDEVDRKVKDVISSLIAEKLDNK